MRTVLAGVLCVCLSGRALAAEWWLVATTNDAVFFVDGESFDAVSPATDVWLEIYPDNHGARFFRELVSYDCTHNTSTTLLFATERADGGIGPLREVPSEKRQARAVPVQSADGEILSFVCAPKADRAARAGKTFRPNAAVAEQFFMLRHEGVSPELAESMAVNAATAIP